MNAQQIGVPAGSGYAAGQCWQVDSAGQGSWGQCSATTVNQTQTLYDVSTFSGSDFGAKAQACFTAGHAICDGRSLTGAQASASGITIAAGQELILGSVSLTMASGQSITSNGILQGSGNGLTSITGTVVGSGVIIAKAGYVRDLSVKNNDHSSAYDASTQTGGSAGIYILNSSGVHVSDVAFSAGTYNLLVAGSSYYGVYSGISTQSLGVTTTNVYINEANHSTFIAPVLTGATHCVDDEWATGVTFVGMDCENATASSIIADQEVYPAGAGTAQMLFSGGYNESTTAAVVDSENSAGGGHNPPVITIAGMEVFRSANPACIGPGVGSALFVRVNGLAAGDFSCTSIGPDGYGGLGVVGGVPAIDLNNGTNDYGLVLDTNKSGLTVRNQSTNSLIQVNAASFNGVSISTGSAVPTGACTSPTIYLTTAGAMYNCQSGAWVAK